MRYRPPTVAAACAIYADELRRESWEHYVADSLWEVIWVQTGGKYSVDCYSDLVKKHEPKKKDNRTADEIKASLTESLEVKEE